MSRRRDLSDEEDALWKGFARSIKPLKPAKPAAKPAEPGDGAPPSPGASAKPQLPAPAKSPPLAPFDRRLKQRVARGREAIDARLDLHGLTQSEAHAALLRFLRRAQMEGAKFALVVTGKGAHQGAHQGVGRGTAQGVREDAARENARGSSERGVLKRQVPQWLALPEFRPLIVGFEQAHVSHGGEGALYIRLRRPR
jgi:DNA-nicking Smr family endonuclease